MITEYGKFIRIFRLNKGLILKDMAETLDLPSSYLSALEMGRKAIPSNFYDRLISKYNFSPAEKLELQKAIANSALTETFNLQNKSEAKRQAVLSFARKFDDMDDSVAEQIFKLLKDGGSKN